MPNIRSTVTCAWPAPTSTTSLTTGWLTLCTPMSLGQARFLAGYASQGQLTGDPSPAQASQLGSGGALCFGGFPPDLAEQLSPRPLFTRRLEEMGAVRNCPSQAREKIQIGFDPLQ